jgi:hypothetical protein
MGTFGFEAIMNRNYTKKVPIPKTQSWNWYRTTKYLCSFPANLNGNVTNPYVNVFGSPGSGTCSLCRLYATRHYNRVITFHHDTRSDFTDRNYDIGN